ncbi:MAG: hypothetical protein WDN76_07910 [Alphaproteobacteria bacterium]
MIGRRGFLYVLTGVAPALAYASEPSPAQIVADSDAFRLPPMSAGGAVRADLRIIDGQGAGRRVDSVTVLTRDTSSLAQITDGDQRGMKFLSSPAGYWLYAPNTRRAIRLTPLQLLRGQASMAIFRAFAFRRITMRALRRNTRQTSARRNAGRWSFMQRRRRRPIRPSDSE